MNWGVSSVLALLLAAVNLCTAVYTPPNAYNFSVWTGSNESWFLYPEILNNSNYSIPIIQKKPTIGIALSGGGFRAATLGLGYLRALYLLGVTTSAKYLTSNSGGSWLAATFSFQNDVDLGTFFGPYIPPDQLNLSTVQKGNGTKGNFAGVIANAGILVPGAVGAVSDVVKTLKPGDQKGVGAWSNAVGKAFLDPYGLNSESSTFTAASTRGPVHQQALQATNASAVEVYTYHPGAHGNVSDQRPFPIMLGSILIQNSSLGFYPVEFTPLYIGCPAFFNNTDPPLGAGFVDPQGFNSAPPEPKPAIPAPILRSFAATRASVTGTDNGTLTTNQTVNSTTAAGRRLMQLEPLSVRGQPDFLVPLKQVMGISSSFITNMFKPTGTITRELTGTEVLQYWNQIDFTGKQLAFADGGSADNLVITPLLRRRITKIIATVAASQNVTATANSSDFAGYQYDVAALFGACPPTHPAYDKKGTIVGTPPDLFNRKLQVFPTAGYEQLYASLRKSAANGGPTYHEATYTVLTNPYQAVFGGWQVEVLWVFNQQQTAWEQLLPQETANALAQARRSEQQSSRGISGVIKKVENAADFALSQLGVDVGTWGLKDFPFIDTGKADYTPELTTLLDQMASWQMLQLQPQLQRLLQGTGAKLQPISQQALAQIAQRAVAATPASSSAPAPGPGTSGGALQALTYSWQLYLAATALWWLL